MLNINSFPNLFPYQFYVSLLFVLVVTPIWWYRVTPAKRHRFETRNLGPVVIVMVAIFGAIEALYMFDCALRPYLLAKIDPRMYLVIGSLCVFIMAVLAIRDQKPE